MEAELESYQFQLSQVSVALEADPSNAELEGLKAELEQIIELTKEAIGVSAGPSTSIAAPASSTAASHTPNASTSISGDRGKKKDVGRSIEGQGYGAAGPQVKQAFKSGEDVSAKYKDGKWYEARVTAVTRSSDSPLYTVIFKGYTTPTTLNSSQVRALTLNNVQAPPDPVKRKADEMDEREKEKKKKKNEKWTSTMTARTEETVQKKNAWESFGKKAAKKGVKIGGLQGKSIFRTPDNPMGKVGVVGSGQGVTAYEQRGKHKFQPGSTGNAE